MAAGRDSGRACGIAVRPVHHRVLRAERRAAHRLAGIAPPALRRIDGSVQRIEPPSFIRAVADGGDDEHVARAGRGHVREPLRFRLVARRLLRIVQQQIDRRPAGELQRAQAVLGIDPASGFRPREPARQIREHDDRELEPFGLVDGEHRHCIGVRVELCRCRIVARVDERLEMARDEGTTRSALYTAALKQMLKEKRDAQITAKINRLIEEDGLDTGIDDWMREANRRTAERVP